MAKMTMGDLKRIEEIARLQLEERENEEILRDLEEILKHFERISELPDEKEMYYVYEKESEKRPDSVEVRGNEDEILSGFARKQDRFEKVPKNLRIA